MDFLEAGLEARSTAWHYIYLMDTIRPGQLSYILGLNSLVVETSI